MQMVLDTADFNQVTFVAPDGTADVFVELIGKLCVDRLAAIFRAKDDMVGEMGIGTH